MNLTNGLGLTTIVEKYLPKAFLSPKVQVEEGWLDFVECSNGIIVPAGNEPWCEQVLRDQHEGRTMAA